MSLQFIMGNSGSGKSYCLYDTVVREAIENPDKNYLVIVPEQFTMQTQKDLCLAHPKGGIMNIDVLSFGRLAYRVFEEVGQDARVVLDDEGKNLVLRKIAGECEKDLKVFKGNLKKQGYIIKRHGQKYLLIQKPILLIVKQKVFSHMHLTENQIQSGIQIGKMEKAIS